MPQLFYDFGTNVFLIYTQNWSNFGFDLFFLWPLLHFQVLLILFTYSSFLDVWSPNLTRIYYRKLVWNFHPNFYHRRLSNFASTVDKLLEFSIFQRTIALIILRFCTNTILVHIFRIFWWPVKHYFFSPSLIYVIHYILVCAIVK